MTVPQDFRSALILCFSVTKGTQRRICCRRKCISILRDAADFDVEHREFLLRPHPPMARKVSACQVEAFKVSGLDVSRLPTAATTSDHAKLHATGFADHVLVPGRVPNELDISFVDAVDT